jgi:asparagine synthetase B (glutamine-hydrolysing)
MPGIVGLITKAPLSAAKPQLLSMLKAISYDSCYKTGTWMSESLGVYIGWTAIDGSFSDGMPLLNEKGDVCLVFSGEEYSGRGNSSSYSGKEECNGSQDSA